MRRDLHLGADPHRAPLIAHAPPGQRAHPYPRQRGRTCCHQTAIELTKPGFRDAGSLCDLGKSCALNDASQAKRTWRCSHRTSSPAGPETTKGRREDDVLSQRPASGSPSACGTATLLAYPQVAFRDKNFQRPPEGPTAHMSMWASPTATRVRESRCGWPTDNDSCGSAIYRLLSRGAPWWNNPSHRRRTPPF